MASSAIDAPPQQHYYPPDSSIPGRVPEFYFNLSMIYFVLITVGGVLCYPYDKNDPFFKIKPASAVEVAEGSGAANEEDQEETHSLIKAKSSPSPTSSRKSFYLEGEEGHSEEERSLLGALDTRPGQSAVSGTHALELSPYDLAFEPMSYLFEMCMVFTNVGGERQAWQPSLNTPSVFVDHNYDHTHINHEPHSSSVLPHMSSCVLCAVQACT